jgi:hypothetical protein
MIRRWKKFWADTTGSVTVEFVLYVPFIMMLMLSSIELGMIMTRHVLLDRAVEASVREVRLGQLDPVNHDTLSERICEIMLGMPNCATDVRLELETLNPRNLTLISDDVDCVDRGDPEKPLRSQFDTLDSNRIAIVRACALFDPIFPTTGLGASIRKESEGAYALVSTSLFVVEPRD